MDESEIKAMEYMRNEHLLKLAHKELEKEGLIKRLDNKGGYMGTERGLIEKWKIITILTLK